MEKYNLIEIVVDVQIYAKTTYVRGSFKLNKICEKPWIRMYTPN